MFKPTREMTTKKTRAEQFKILDTELKKYSILMESKKKLKNFKLFYQKEASLIILEEFMLHNKMIYHKQQRFSHFEKHLIINFESLRNKSLYRML